MPKAGKPVQPVSDHKGPSTLSDFSDIIAKMGDEKREKQELTRAFGLKMDKEHPVDPDVEKISALVDHHNRLIRVLGGFTGFVLDTEEQIIEHVDAAVKLRQHFKELLDIPGVREKLQAIHLEMNPAIE